MAQELLALVADMAEEMDGVELYPDYSGRAMFGRTCAGFTLDRDVTPLAFFGQLLEAANYMGAEDREALLSALPKMMLDARTDATGLGTILYFPSFYFPSFYVLGFEG